ncbi:hypothetical protein ACQP2H_30455 [Micromonospora sp. CA-248260]|uniref:hypothetical protein n=1 Tax=Micromonospora sp. CA-248260 TaxID=3239962 RepID=UPI003D8FE155
MDLLSWGGLAAAVVTSLTGLVTLWIRARWRVNQERTRGESLIAIAEALPSGARLRDQRADGSSITLTLSAHTSAGGHRG